MSQFAAKLQSKTRGLNWILMGIGGVGKSNLAIKLFGILHTYVVNLELGIDHITDEEGNTPQGISREELPDLKSFYELIDYLAASEYKAVVFDSLSVLWGYIFAQANGKKFEYAAEGGWDNKNKAAEEGAKFVKAIQKLTNAGKHVIYTGHTKMAPYNDPMEEKPYDRFTLDSPYEPLAQAFIRMADNVGFCHYETEKRADQGKNKIKVDGDGSRIILFENRPYATDCKNRSGLPALVQMDVNAEGLRAALAAASNNKGKTPEQITADIKALLARAPQKVSTDKTILMKIDKAQGNLAELVRIKDGLTKIVEG